MSLAARPADAWGARPYELALALGPATLHLRPLDEPHPAAGGLLDVARFLADADRADRAVLGRTRGTVLDVGCGPGRMIAEARRRGRPALGIDVSPAAVAVATSAGRPALLRSVFEPVPAEGTWGTTLLLDGNIGIGGDPAALLARCAELTAPGGTVAVETHDDPDHDHRFEAQLVTADGSGSGSFPWARTGRRVVERLGRAAGLEPVDGLRRRGRHFVLLRRSEDAS